MGTATDPTLRALERFGDKSRWVIEDAVPVFDAHDERDPQGVIVRQYGLNELRRIADNCNRREIETGDPAPITLGHTQEGAPETSQPPIVGYARRFRIGRFGPADKLGILCTMYFFKERYREAMEYPRRSVELWLKEQILDPIALLKRTPKRDLGLLTYAAARRQRLFYQLENTDMDMPNTPGTHPEHTPATQEPPMVPHPHPDYPHEHEHLAHAHEAVHHVMHYLAHHPVFKYAHQCYMASVGAGHHTGVGGPQHHMGGAAGPGTASGSNTFIPGMHGSHQHMYQREPPRITNPLRPGGDSGTTPPVQQPGTEQQRQQDVQTSIEVARYQREVEDLQKANQQLTARFASMERESRVARYERDLGHLISQGYEITLSEELKEVSDYSAEQFARHIERIKKYYRRAPLGNSFVPLESYANEGGGGAPKPVTREERDAAVKEASRGDLDSNAHYGNYDAALKFIREGKTNGHVRT